MTLLLDSRLPEIAQEPVVLAVLTVLLILAAYYQRTLSYQEYRLAHGLRTVGAIVLDSRVNFRLLTEKGMPEKDTEYVRSVPMTIRRAFATLRHAGASPHLISGIKYREHPERGREYAAAHLIFVEGDKQTEVWLFPAADGDGTDIYAHKETYITDPEGHLSEPYTPGDPDGYIAAALEDA